MTIADKFLEKERLERAQQEQERRDYAKKSRRANQQSTPRPGVHSKSNTNPGGTWSCSVL